MHTDQTHRFTVEVTGCSREQAEQVMIERIQHDEDYGFAYTIDWQAAPRDAAPLFDAADDHELQTLEDLARRAGVMRDCSGDGDHVHWTAYRGESCGVCGRPFADIAPTD